MRREIRVLKREGHALPKDVDDCLAILWQADILAHAGVRRSEDWRMVVVFSRFAEAITMLRSKGFDVTDKRSPAASILSPAATPPSLKRPPALALLSRARVLLRAWLA